MPDTIPPILRDVPEQFESARLLLRMPRAGDGPTINAATLESLDNLRPWMPWAKDTPTLADSEHFARRGAIQYQQRTAFPMLLFRKSDGLFVGGSGLNDHVDWAVPRFEIGYWVRVSLQGQGFITEAVNAISAFAFQHLEAERVEIRCDARNTRSAAVAERCGYTLEARLRRHERDHFGELRDTLVFALLRDEWTAGL